MLNVADKDIVEYLEEMQEKERLRLAPNSTVNVLVNPNIPLKRCLLLKFLFYGRFSQKELQLQLNHLLFFLTVKTDVLLCLIKK